MSRRQSSMLRQSLKISGCLGGIYLNCLQACRVLASIDIHMRVAGCNLWLPNLKPDFVTTGDCS